jgi:hypothetical protein
VTFVLRMENNELLRIDGRELGEMVEAMPG